MHIVGHQGVQARLKKLATLAEYPQSFLFVGPESVGKRLVALQFAWSVMGQGEDFDGREESDVLHPDMSFLTPERVTEKGKTREKNIPVEAIREGIHFLSRYPLTGKRRILIINDAHRLSSGAQNALLKTLEEPNPTSLLILITHDAAALFDTLHSRLQRVPFSLVAAEEMRTLGTLKPENDFLLALGRPGLIKAALMDTEAFGDKKDFLERLSRLGDMTVSERFRLAEDMSKESALVPELLLWLAAMVREKGRITSAPHREATYFFLEALLETESLLRGTQANTRLQLEKLFLKAS